MTNLLKVLASLPPPKASSDADITAEAKAGIPLLPALLSLPDRPLHSGIKCSLAIIYNAMEAVGAADLLSGVTLDLMEATDAKLRERDFNPVQYLPNLAPLLVKRDAFAAGIVLAFNMVLSLIQGAPAAQPAETALKAMSGETGDEDETMEVTGEAEEPEDAPKASAKPATKWEPTNNVTGLLMALKAAGLPMSDIKLEPIEGPSGISLVVTNEFKAPVAFSTLAKICAIFKVVSPSQDVSVIARDGGTIVLVYKI